LSQISAAHNTNSYNRYRCAYQVTTFVTDICCTQHRQLQQVQVCIPGDDICHRYLLHTTPTVTTGTGVHTRRRCLSQTSAAYITNHYDRYRCAYFVTTYSKPFVTDICTIQYLQLQQVQVCILGDDICHRYLPHTTLTVTTGTGVHTR